MKILKDGEVIKAGDIILFGYNKEVDFALVAYGYAGDVKGRDPYLAFVFRMSDNEQDILRQKLKELE